MSFLALCLIISPTDANHGRFACQDPSLHTSYSSLCHKRASHLFPAHIPYPSPPISHSSTILYPLHCLLPSPPLHTRSTTPPASQSCRLTTLAPATPPLLPLFQKSTKRSRPTANVSYRGMSILHLALMTMQVCWTWSHKSLSLVPFRLSHPGSWCLRPRGELRPRKNERDASAQ